MMYKQESRMDSCLIFARGAKNIRIEGNGAIDGQGLKAHFPNRSDARQRRPLLLRFVDCSAIRLRDVTLKDPAAWTTAWLYCRDVVVDGVTIQSRANDNGDGLDFDGCQSVRVSNCAFDTSDDSICLQTSRPAAPCQDVVITNCIFRSQWAGIRIGLLSRGDIGNVTVSNCTFTDIRDAGLKIQMCEGGTMENLTFSNLIMKNVPRPVFMTFCQQRACVDAPEEVAPMKAMRRILFQGLVVDSGACDQHSAIILTGLPGHPIEDIVLSDLVMQTGGGGTRQEGAARSLPEFTLATLEGWWPEYYGLKTTIPCHGIYARHVKGLTVRHADLSTAREDARPAIICDDVVDLEIDGVRARGNAVMPSLIRLQNARRAFIHSCRAAGDCGVLVRTEGPHTADIQVTGNALPPGCAPLVQSKAVNASQAAPQVRQK
jgi:hypothetical protein